MIGTMKFDRHLYVSDSIRNLEKVKWKLRHNAGQITIYIIALAKSDDQLDIFHCSLLQQRFYDKKDLFVVGLADWHASKKEEAGYLGTLPSAAAVLSSSCLRTGSSSASLLASSIST